MKFQLMSDLHLEFGPYEPKNKGAETLLIAGDAFVSGDYLMLENSIYDFPEIQESIDNYNNFLSRASSEFDCIVHINGNHEHYHGDIAKTRNVLQSKLFDQYPKVAHLDNDAIVIGDVCVLGSTLWTDFGGGDRVIMRTAEFTMNDYHKIINTRRPITSTNVLQRLEAEDVFGFHDHSKLWLEEMLSSVVDFKIVVMTHHAPSYQSVFDTRKQSYSELYASDLDNFIKSHDNIAVWCHGHVHHNKDYMIGNTRVLCAPRGYVGHESISKHYNDGILFEV